MDTNSTFQFPPPRVVVDQDGVLVDDVVFTERVGWLIDARRAATTAILAGAYSPAGVAQLVSGVDGTGSKLPSQAERVASRLGWRTECVNSRVLAMAQVEAVTVMRGQAHRVKHFAVVRDALAGMDPSTFPNARERRRGRHIRKVTDTLSKDHPGVDEPTLMALTRSLLAWWGEHGHWPDTYFTMWPTPPRASHVVNLGHVNRQQAYRVVDGNTYTLHVRLPVCAQPTSMKDYQWVTAEYDFPPHVRARVTQPASRVTLPVLHRYPDGRIACRATLVEPVPQWRGDPDVAVGVDYGINRPYVATVVRHVGQGQYVAANRTYDYDDRGMYAKSVRLMEEAEQLHAKITHYTTLIANNPNPGNLPAKLAVAERNYAHVTRRRRNLNNEMVHDQAIWKQTIVDLSGAGSLHEENLASLPNDLGPTHRVRMSQFPRSQAQHFTHHHTTRHGTYYTLVPARGTSRTCPYCLHTLTHTRWVDTTCTNCGATGHRDDLAPIRIAQRGHATNPKKRTHPRDGQPRRIKRVVDTPVRRTRDKFGPTPKQVKKTHAKGRRRTAVTTPHKPTPSRTTVVRDRAVAQAGTASHVTTGEVGGTCYKSPQQSP